MSNSSIWPIDKTLSDAIILGQNGPGSDGNEEVLCIPQITGASPSDCFVSYGTLVGGVLPNNRDAVGEFYSPSRLGQRTMNNKIIK